MDEPSFTGKEIIREEVKLKDDALRCSCFASSRMNSS